MHMIVFLREACGRGYFGDRFGYVVRTDAVRVDLGLS